MTTVREERWKSARFCCTTISIPTFLLAYFTVPCCRPLPSCWRTSLYQAIDPYLSAGVIYSYLPAGVLHQLLVGVVAILAVIFLLFLLFRQIVTNSEGKTDVKRASGPTVTASLRRSRGGGMGRRKGAREEEWGRKHV